MKKFFLFLTITVSIILVGCNSSDNEDIEFELLDVSSEVKSCSANQTISIIDTVEEYNNSSLNGSEYSKEILDSNIIISIEHISTSSSGDFDFIDMVLVSEDLIILFSQKGILLSFSCSSITISVSRDTYNLDDSNVLVKEVKYQNEYLFEDELFTIYDLPNNESIIVYEIDNVTDRLIANYILEDNKRIYEDLYFNFHDITISQIEIQSNELTFESKVFTKAQNDE